MPSPRVLAAITIYETKLRLYFVGVDLSRDECRILKVDRTTTQRDSLVTEDEATYTHAQMTNLLQMIDDGNKSQGGLKRLMQVEAVCGFVRFLEGFYVLVVTKCSVVAEIGSHQVYSIDDTRLIGVTQSVNGAKRSPDEQRFIDIFCSMDLTKNFYFSRTFDITHSFQHNCLHSQSDETAGGDYSYMDMFVWNHFLLSTAFRKVSKQSPWVLPIIYGFIQQSKISVIGRTLLLTLIARRSRHFAGARFLKRGVNLEGYVANDVETEQIIIDASYAGRQHTQGRCTSFVQHRGSIPLYWSQETTNMAPKPPIQINIRDPFYSAAALHFDNLFMRYHAPIVVLNLVKHRETTKRESILLEEYTEAVTYLNQFLPDDKKIRYIAFDMSRAAKSPDQDVIGILEKLAEESLKHTNFFHSELTTTEGGSIVQTQSGVIRTNCIDCLDRTNAAQFIIGKCALAYQLHALALIPAPVLPLDCDATKILMEMYHDHGDIIALQYGGSALVNTMETYRKTTDWTSQSRDMIETIKRYYNNSFTDAEKQNAINVFLGNFSTGTKRATLTEPVWEVENDFSLHMSQDNPPSNYVDWFHPQFLIGTAPNPLSREYRAINASFEDYYNTRRITSFGDSFLCNMNDADKDSKAGDPTASPFHDNGQVPLKVKDVSAIDDEDTSEDEQDQTALSYNDFANPTAVLARSLMESKVSVREQEEYSRYVTQFRDNQMQSSESMNNNPEHYAYYTEYLKKTTVDLPGANRNENVLFQVDAKDRAIYEKHVNMTKKPCPTPDTYTHPMYDGYRRWLDTGRYANNF